MIFAARREKRRKNINSWVRISFLHSLAIFVKLEEKKYQVKPTQSAAGSFGGKSCSLVEQIFKFSLTEKSRKLHLQSDKLIEWKQEKMSSVYSMHRPGFWRVPKFKSKEPQGGKKKVHFYDEFVSAFPINLSFLVWQRTRHSRQPLVIALMKISFRLERAHKSMTFSASNSREIRSTNNFGSPHMRSSYELKEKFNEPPNENLFAHMSAKGLPMWAGYRNIRRQ